jgi:hypothetical protein
MPPVSQRHFPPRPPTTPTRHSSADDEIDYDASVWSPDEYVLSQEDQDLFVLSQEDQDLLDDMRRTTLPDAEYVPPPSFVLSPRVFGALPAAETTALPRAVGARPFSRMMEIDKSSVGGKMTGIINFNEFFKQYAPECARSVSQGKVPTTGDLVLAKYVNDPRSPVDILSNLNLIEAGQIMVEYARHGKYTGSKKCGMLLEHNTIISYTKIVQRYMLCYQGRNEHLFSLHGGAWSMKSSPQFYEYRETLKKRGKDMAVADITSNGNIQRLSAAGGNASSILPAHVFAFINYLTNYMLKFEKYNYVKLDDYKLAKNGNTGFADYVGAALQKTILIYGYNGCNRGRQDFDRCMLEDFHEVGDIGV